MLIVANWERSANLDRQIAGWMWEKNDSTDSTLSASQETPFVSISADGLYFKQRFFRLICPRIGSLFFNGSRMTFFIQSCPACSRRFEVSFRALGKTVECRFCHSVFHSFDDSEDSSEASDRIDSWAKEIQLPPASQTGMPPEPNHGVDQEGQAEGVRSDWDSTLISLRPK